MNKKTIYITIVTFLVLIGVGASSYFLIFKKSSAPPPSDTSATEIPEQKLEYLTKGGVISPVLAFDNLSVWYFEKSTGRLLRQHLEKLDDIREFPLPFHEAVEFVIWPDEGGDFIMGNSQNKFLYAANTNEFIPYPLQAKFIQWLQGGQKVAYIWSDQTDAFLSSARSDMSDFQSIVEIPEDGFRFAVAPNGRSFMLYSGSSRHPLYFVVDSLGVLEPVTENAAIINGRFSPDGTKFAYVTADNRLNVLELSSKRVTMGCSLNSASSFVWSNDSSYIYCGQADGLIKKSLATGIDLPVADSKDIRVSEMILANDEKYLFFIESGTGRLGRIRL